MHTDVAVDAVGVDVDITMLTSPPSTSTAVMSLLL